MSQNVNKSKHRYKLKDLLQKIIGLSLSVVFITNYTGFQQQFHFILFLLIFAEIYIHFHLRAFVQIKCLFCAWIKFVILKMYFLKISFEEILWHWRYIHTTGNRRSFFSFCKYFSWWQELSDVIKCFFLLKEAEYWSIKKIYQFSIFIQL